MSGGLSFRRRAGAGRLRPHHLARRGRFGQLAGMG